MSRIINYCCCSILFLALMLPLPLLADEAAAPPPPAITEDANRMLELGQLLMGENNPKYAPVPHKISPEQRNIAGQQAQQLFIQLTVLYPDFPDGWLWLGIASTYRLHYQNDGSVINKPLATEELASALRAFRNALALMPQNLLYATYYGDALMSYLQDFDAAQEFWLQYHDGAQSDLQRMTALVQVSRSQLNKAYFAFQYKNLPTADIKSIFTAAENFAAQAAKIMPRASDVTDMQKLLKQYQPILAPRN